MTAEDLRAQGITGNNRGANALQWFQAVSGFGTDVLSAITGNAQQQNIPLNPAAPAPGAPSAPAKDNTMWWVIGLVVLVLLVVLYFIFRKK